ncbi:MAG: Xaa-Pro peptidase family protein [Lentisphaeria bacterium]
MNSTPTALVTNRSPIDLLFTPDFTADELRERRQRIAEMIGREAHLLIAGAPPCPAAFARVQDASFYYFCGLYVPHSYLLVEGGSGKTTLFLPPRDAMTGMAQDKLGFEDAEMIKGKLRVEHVKSTAEMTAALANIKLIYTPFAEIEGGGASLMEATGCAKKREAEEWDQAEPRHKRLIRLLRERVPGIKVEDAIPLIRQLRTIKSPAEIEILRQAGQLSANVMVEAMKATRPGITENRLQAVAEYVFRDQGHAGLGYGVIAAGGKRTWDGHYFYNNQTLNEDEVVLMDCGPDLRHYTSDIARVWPVNGAFDEWHRRLYKFIVEYHKTLLSLVRPGALPADIYDEAARQMTERCTYGPEELRMMKPTLDQMIEKGVKYLNHCVGLSVHDAINTNWRNEPLREGVVCVMDPMVWCEPQHEYIRVEDTLVVTADGCERLTDAAPIELNEVEALARISQKFGLKQNF